MNISEKKIKLLTKNPVFVILSLNTFLVIIGYALGTIFGGNSVIVTGMRIFKVFFLFFSFIYAVTKNGLSTKFLNNRPTIFILLLAVSFFSFFSNDLNDSLYKTFSFIYPFLYLIFSVNYLLKYNAVNVLISISFVILIIYSLVPVTYFVLGGVNLDGVFIYGKSDENYFVSNHYGWSCALFILSSFTVLRFYPLKNIYKWLIVIILQFVFYLLIVTVNRAAIFSIIVALIFLTFKSNSFKFYQKTLLILSVSFIFLFISNKQNSAIEFLYERSTRQYDSGDEARLIGTNAMFNSFKKNSSNWFTGVGMFNYSELKSNGGILSSYHNSYWEILFGSGILVFILFIKFMLFTPFKVFWKKTNYYSLLFFPLVIIPFFESNLTAGQFLFFPWFTYIIIMNAKEFNLEI